MNKKILIIGLVAILLIGALAFVNSSNSSENNNQPNESTSNTIPGEALANTEIKLREISAQEVASHKSSDDCWTIIDSKVYDITSYIPRHQGGDVIEKACGIDSTSFFKDRKTSEGEKVGSGTPHSNSAENQLESLVIGNLKS